MTTYELAITRGRLLDGCGNPWFYGDLGVQDGRIARLAPPGRLHGRREIDADGRYVAPGFIDPHTHSDLSLLVDRRGESARRQGVTTHVVGNCGMSPAPVGEGRLEEMKAYWGRIAEQPQVSWAWRSFGEYLKALQEGGLGINAAALCGHAALRSAAMGMAPGAPTEEQLRAMGDLLEEALRAGAVGLSTGLVYPPGCYADTQEVIELCQRMAKHGGVYTSHIRGERETVLEAVAEAIHIGKQGGVAVHISHNAPKFGAPCDARATLGLVDEARRAGQDVTVDNDVHTDLAPALVDALPQPLHSLPPAELQSRLNEASFRQQVQSEIVEDRRPAFGPAGLLKHGQWGRITLLHAPRTPEAVGKTIQALAEGAGAAPFDVYFDLIVANGEEAVAIFDYIDEENIRILLRHPATMICSDGEALTRDGFLNDPPPYSPCSYGEYPGILERYVREQETLTLEEAIRKMTSFPAQRFGFAERGELRPGMWADVVVFDLERVHDRATNLFPHSYPFVNFPHDYPEGIDYVLVNGTVVVEDGEDTGLLPGRALRGPGWMGA